MINDRLSALKAAGNNNYDAYDEISIQMDEVDNFMSEFFNEVEDISLHLDKISAAVEEVKKKHSAILSAPSTDEKVKDELEDLMSEIKRLLNKVRQKLKLMAQNIEQQEHVNQTSANFRIRITQHSALSKRFENAITVYNKVQADYRQRCKDRIKRQLEITGHTRTDEEIEKMLESGNPAIFTQDIEIESQKARQTVADIENRYADIIKVEKSIRELHELFLDISVLVDSQGELIDRIEYNVQNTADFVDKGRDNLKQAEVYKSKTRKKVIILSIIAVIVLIILGLVIVYALK